jgi:hypothetical protein
MKIVSGLSESIGDIKFGSGLMPAWRDDVRNGRAGVLFVMCTWRTYSLIP